MKVVPSWILKDQKLFFKQGQILNHIQGVQIQLTPDNKGRGVYAAKDLSKGDLLIVEKAIIQASTKKQMVQMFMDIAQNKGIETLRLSYLWDGWKRVYTESIPPLEIFRKNDYKKYEYDKKYAGRFDKMREM